MQVCNRCMLQRLQWCSSTSWRLWLLERLHSKISFMLTLHKLHCLSATRLIFIAYSSWFLSLQLFPSWGPVIPCQGWSVLHGIGMKLLLLNQLSTVVVSTVLLDNQPGKNYMYLRSLQTTIRFQQPATHCLWSWLELCTFHHTSQGGLTFLDCTK